MGQDATLVPMRSSVTGPRICPTEPDHSSGSSSAAATTTAPGAGDLPQMTSTGPPVDANTTTAPPDGKAWPVLPAIFGDAEGGPLSNEMLSKIATGLACVAVVAALAFLVCRSCRDKPVERKRTTRKKARREEAGAARELVTAEFESLHRSYEFFPDESPRESPEMREEDFAPREESREEFREESSPRERDGAPLLRIPGLTPPVLPQVVLPEAVPNFAPVNTYMPAPAPLQPPPGFVPQQGTATLGPPPIGPPQASVASFGPVRYA